MKSSEKRAKIISNFDRWMELLTYIRKGKTIVLTGSRWLNVTMWVHLPLLWNLMNFMRFSLILEIVSGFFPHVGLIHFLFSLFLGSLEFYKCHLFFSWHFHHCLLIGYSIWPICWILLLVQIIFQLIWMDFLKRQLHCLQVKIVLSLLFQYLYALLLFTVSFH